MTTRSGQLVVRDSSSWSLVRCSSGSTAVVMHNTTSNEIALATSGAPADEDYEDRNYFSLLEDTTKPQAPRGVEPDAMNSGYYKKFFVQQKRLGMGADGAVFLVTHCINGVELGQYALKKVPIGDNYDWLKITLREVKTLEALRQHPNIVNYKHSWLEMDTLADFGPVVPCLHILMEYVDGGNLEDYVLELKRSLDVQEIWHLFLDLTFGLDYLHSKGIIHRDIKGPNMLLSKVYDPDTGEFRRYKLMISDFGTAIFKKRVGIAARTGNTGTPEWVPPELIKQHGNLGEYDARCDIWGLGLILYFLAYSKLPWTATREHESDLNDEIIFGVRSLPSTPNRPIEMQHMILALMNKDPAKRPLARDILLSPFVQNLIRTLDDPVQGELHDLVLLETTKKEAKQRKPFKVPELRTLTLLEGPSLTDKSSTRRKSMTDMGSHLLPPSSRVEDLSPRSKSVGAPLKHAPMKAIHKKTENLYTILHLLLFSFKVGSAIFLCSHPNDIYTFVSLCLAAFALVCRDNQLYLTGTSLLEWFWSIMFFATGSVCDKSWLLLMSATAILVLSLVLNFNRYTILQRKGATHKTE